MKSAKRQCNRLIAEAKKSLIVVNYAKMKYQNKKRKIDTITSISYQINNNNVHLSCAHQRPERSHNTY